MDSNDCSFHQVFARGEKVHDFVTHVYSQLAVSVVKFWRKHRLRDPQTTQSSKQSGNYKELQKIASRTNQSLWRTTNLNWTDIGGCNLQVKQRGFLQGGGEVLVRCHMVADVLFDAGGHSDWWVLILMAERCTSKYLIIYTNIYTWYIHMQHSLTWDDSVYSHFDHKPIFLELPNSWMQGFWSKRYRFAHSSGACLTWPLPAVEILHPGEILEVQLKSWKVVGDFSSLVDTTWFPGSWFSSYKFVLLKTRRWQEESENF